MTPEEIEAFGRDIERFMDAIRKLLETCEAVAAVLVTLRSERTALELRTAARVVAEFT